jgi:ribosomal protein S18 acetylase RimI-like enzyme
MHGLNPMTEIIPLLDSTDSVERLSQGLLAHLGASGMPLPEDDCVLDYITSSVRFGSTQAVLAVDGGEALGIAAWRVDQHIGLVVLFYVLPEVAGPVAGAILKRAVDSLMKRSAANPIVGEMPDVTPVMWYALQTNGFVGVERHLMRVDLDRTDLRLDLVPGYSLSSWHSDYADSAAEVVYRANQGTLDAQIIPELSSLESTTRIVAQTQEGRYGKFDEKASGLILTASGKVVGVTLVTRRRSGQGFTAEICVLPGHRRRGLARSLMMQTHAVLAGAGLAHNTLGVTEGNPARLLYQELGYQRIGSVWTFIRPRPANWLA